MAIKIKYKTSLSGSLSNRSFSLSRSGILAHSMRTKPKLWLAAFFILGVVSLTLLFWTLSRTTRPQDSLAQLRQYYSKTDGRPAPRDHPLARFFPKVKGVIVVLCRNGDREEMVATVKNFQGRFNSNFHYPYVFLNNEPFTSEVMNDITRAVGSDGNVKFGTVPKEHWSYPDWIDQQKAARARADMEAKGVLYGGSESYRFMCRYFSGFFYQHPLLQEYEYYWRIEPGVRFTCDINYDVFRYMKDYDKMYGFVITMQEIAETIPTLWSTVLEEFLPNAPARHPRLSETIRYFGPPTPHGYNGCHFWSNFEIASFSFFRSPEYARFFAALDRRGGFFYERWGDAPVHSIAVGLFLRTSQVHYFEDIGYRHDPFSHCPADFALRQANRCDCDPFEPSETSHNRCQNLWNVNYLI